LPQADVENLINWKELASYFEDVVSEIDEWWSQFYPMNLSTKEVHKQNRETYIKRAANWCLQDFSALLNEKGINPMDSKITPENFAELIFMFQGNKISITAAKQVFKVMFEKGGEPDNIVADLGLEQTSDEGAISAAIDKVITANSKAVADYKAGQEKSFGFLVGQAMKELKGKGNPGVINDILKKKLI
jgi:aspartyl-tRNA(Asn)/glutamyl-tRNA(Gln) amidotransferase subunit B